MIRIWYHANCNDGLCAAAIVLSALSTIEDRDRVGETETNPFVDLKAVNYGEPPPLVQVGDHVYIVDFSYKHDVMMMLSQRLGDTGAMVVLDHHKTAFAELAQPFPKGSNVRVEFDLMHSGASITWRYFYADKIPCSKCNGTGLAEAWLPKDHERYGMVCQECRGRKEEYVYRKRIPWFVQVVRERDLWNFERGPVVSELHAGLLMEPQKPEYWMGFLRYDIGDANVIIQNGRAILAYQKGIVERAMKSFWLEKIIVAGNGGEQQYLVPCCMATECISEIGESLLYAKREAPFSMTYRDYQFLDHMTGETKLVRKYSLRSGRKGTASESFDCSVIAKALGGGGHAFACGFERRITGALLPVG